MIVTALVVSLASAAPAAAARGQPEEKPKTLLEEIALFGYVEASYVGNLGHTSADSGGLTSSRQAIRSASTTATKALPSHGRDQREEGLRPTSIRSASGVVFTAARTRRRITRSVIFRDLQDAPGRPSGSTSRRPTSPIRSRSQRAELKPASS